MPPADDSAASILRSACCFNSAYGGEPVWAAAGRGGDAAAGRGSDADGDAEGLSERCSSGALRVAPTDGLLLQCSSFQQTERLNSGCAVAVTVVVAVLLLWLCCGCCFAVAVAVLWL